MSPARRLQSPCPVPASLASWRFYPTLPQAMGFQNMTDRQPVQKGERGDFS